MYYSTTSRSAESVVSCRETFFYFFFIYEERDGGGGVSGVSFGRATKKMAREKSDFGVRTFYCIFDLALIRLGHGQYRAGLSEIAFCPKPF